MVIVWRLIGNIIWTVIHVYWQCAISTMGTVNKKQFTARLSREFVFMFFFGCMIYLCVHVCFVLPWSVESFRFIFGAGITNLNEPAFSLPPHYCWLGAGSIPFRAIANKKQCEVRGLLMSLVIHDWIGDVQDSQGVSASEMTYIVSGGALKSTHSLSFFYKHRSQN